MLRRLACLVLAMALAGPAMADSLTATYGVRLYGAPVGRMVIAVNSNTSAYAAKGEFRTTGLVGLLARVRFTMSARGVGSFPGWHSRSYSEDLDTGYRESATDLTFAAGERQIDPLTALLSALVDRPAAVGCAFDGESFDGKRSMRLYIREAENSAEALICSGQLTRVSGYTAEEMANATGFAFSVEFTRSDGWLTVRRADVATIHGQVALVRR